MSRERAKMNDGTLLVLGWDDPFETWYAVHYDDHDEDAPPRVAIGYHPAEQALLRSERPDAVIGPYPVTDVELLLTKLIPELMGIEPAAEQPMCWACKQPPWQPSPDCRFHPYERLRRA
jgi:hypothetical protein